MNVQTWWRVMYIHIKILRKTSEAGNLGLKNFLVEVRKIIGGKNLLGIIESSCYTWRWFCLNKFCKYLYSMLQELCFWLMFLCAIWSCFQIEFFSVRSGGSDCVQRCRETELVSDTWRVKNSSSCKANVGTYFIGEVFSKRSFKLVYYIGHTVLTKLISYYWLRN